MTSQWAVLRLFAQLLRGSWQKGGSFFLRISWAPKNKDGSRCRDATGSAAVPGWGHGHHRGVGIRSSDAEAERLEFVQFGRWTPPMAGKPPKKSHWEVSPQTFLPASGEIQSGRCGYLRALDLNLLVEAEGISHGTHEFDFVRRGPGQQEVGFQELPRFQAR